MILAATRAPGKLEQCMGTVHHRSGFVPPPIRLDKRATGLSDPVPFRQITGEVGPGAEPYPPDGWGAKPDLGPGADPMRHLYDHARCRRRARVLGASQR